LVVLWLRSYWRWDEYYYPHGMARGTVVGAVQGVVMLAVNFRDSLAPNREPKLWLQTATKWYERPKEGPAPFLFYFADDSFGINAPHCVLIAIAGAFAALPLIRRFSLRTLLIATTFVAVGLGLILWGIS